MKKNKNNTTDPALQEKIACARKTSIGGQALIEGIMMRGPKMSAMAVRNTKGEIVLEKTEITSSNRPKIFKLPIIRGVFNFVDSMRIGYKCLMRSAEISGLDEIEEELAREKEAKKQAKKAKKKGVTEPVVENAENETVITESSDVSDMNAEPDTADTELNMSEPSENNVEDGDKKDKKENSLLVSAIMVIASVLGVALSIGLFIMLPTFIYDWATKLMPFMVTDNLAIDSLIKSFFEGVLKIAVLVGYMALVTLMKDIRRTFQYHGAEHKTIFCYESGLELTVENVRKQRRFHPRCGTSFLVLMLLVGMFVSFFIDPIFYLTIGHLPHVAIRALIKLLLLPLTMGIGYELIKFAGRHENAFTRIISAPGLWLQRVTVLEPTDDMIECAIAAFVEVIPEDQSDKY
ncbi:MAG: DUF1385 domain-containing protein [Clostridia bacterium]|nr:DUF1385 domain-containing protein [Clostridia bacterium]